MGPATSFSTPTRAIHMHSNNVQILNSLSMLMSTIGCVDLNMPHKMEK
jgi:hypothetical protein